MGADRAFGGSRQESLDRSVASVVQQGCFSSRQADRDCGVGTKTVDDRLQIVERPDGILLILGEQGGVMDRVFVLALFGRGEKKNALIYESGPGMAGPGFDNQSPQERVFVKNVNHKNSGSPHLRSWPTWSHEKENGRPMRTGPA